MNDFGYVTFLERMGHTIRKCAGVYWFDAHPRVYMSVPYQTLVNPDDVIINNVLHKDGLALRYPCKLGRGKNSYRLVVDTPSYDFPYLQPRRRSQTRRGLERCIVRRIDFSELITKGHNLNKDTLERQKRVFNPKSESYWNRYFHEASLTDCAEAWGAYVDSKLASYLIAFQMEQVSHILILRSSTELLDCYPNNALLFRYIQTVLREKIAREVSYGYEPIQGQIKGLEQFKLSMGFHAKPIGQIVDFSPWVRSVIGSPLGTTIPLIANFIFRHNEKAKKLAGLVRWYRSQQKG
jgi:hypothetical protein